MDKNLAMFYFWAHSEIYQLATPKFTEFIERADVIFLENASDVRLAKQLEDIINTDFRKKSLSRELSNSISSSDYVNLINVLFNLTKDKNKKIVLEKTGLCPFGQGYDIEDARARAAFLRYDLEIAMQFYSKFIKVCVQYQTKREIEVVKQIIEIEQPVLVLFGQSHLAIAEGVKPKKNVEVYCVYQKYGDYEDQIFRQFKTTGKIQTDTYLRLRAQGLISFELNQLRGREFSRQVILGAGHLYATLLTPEQILAYRIHLIKHLTSGNNDCLLDLFLSKHNLPKTVDILKQAMMI